MSLYLRKNMLAPSDYLALLKERFVEAANDQNAAAMAAYMKNRFDFYGIKSPDRSKISKALIKEEGLPEREELKTLCRLCFGNLEKREVQYFVNDLLQKAMRHLDQSFLELIDELIPLKSWWDSVDFLAPKLAGSLFLKYPDKMESLSTKWINSENFWYQRAAIIFQLSYKTKTRSDLLFSHILRRADSNEFFVQKGAGWALRQYSKTAADEVRQFISMHKLPPLTVKEGSKYL